ncbi:sensor histidine kinase [Kribbella sp. NBC_00359]|uniref:sensor histidine kinase n=1 Tax=Kribbella sp. NBC_00359 TaxID=2975966 RepID=UPI002E1FE4EB
MAPTRLNLPGPRWLRGLLLGVALVAAVTGVVALLKQYVPVLSLLVLYLLAVLPIAVVWGARWAAITSVVSVAAFAFLLPPEGSVLIADSRNVVALGVFLVTAVVVAELAARSRRAAMRSERLITAQSALRRIATLVAESDAPKVVFEAVTREVGLLFGADLARMERYEADGTVIGVAAWSRVPVQLTVGTRFNLDGLSVARDVGRTGEPVRLDSFEGATGEIAGEARALGIRSSVGCPIVVAGQVWGVIAASKKSDEPFPANTESQIARFTELVATAIENTEARAELHRMADEQAALRRVATLAARGGAPDLVFAAVAQELGQLTDADITGIFRFEPDGTATLMGSRGMGEGELRIGDRWRPESPSAIASVQATGQSARYDVDDTQRQRLPPFLRDWGIKSAVASPILVERRCWGGISIASRRGPFPLATEQRMVEFTEIVATAIANAESQAQLRASRARVIAAGDDMRRRLERDLHDGAQQRLVSLALELRLAQAAVPGYLPQLRAGIGQAAADLTEVVDELREIARGIHPAILAEGGLGPALRTLARRAAAPVDVNVGTRSRYPPPIEVATYYVVSEALTNMAKHADASRAEVSLEEQAGALRLRVRDDGAGGAEPRGGSGLVGLRDRVEALGGSIDVVSPVGHGTVIDVSLPLERPGDTAPQDRPPEPG